MFKGVRGWFVTLIFPGKTNNNNKQFKHSLQKLSLVTMLGLPVLVQGSPTGSFVQDDWSGGPSTASASHPGNEIGWLFYEVADDDLIVGADLSLRSLADSARHTSDADFALNPDTRLTLTSDEDFATGAVLTNTVVNSGSLVLDVAAINPVWSADTTWNVIDIGSNSAPALVDLDGDGDLDFLGGNSTGAGIAYENVGSLIDGPQWLFKSAWGFPDIGANASPAAADLDGDGDVDLMVGNSAGLVLAFENTGDVTAPVWTANPGWDLPVDLGANVAPTLADLDGDGDVDLLVGDGNGFVVAYENTGSAASPSWAANTAWDVVDGENVLIDMGSFAAPALVDFDEDGDFDLIIGDSSGYVRVYENTGTVSAPLWTAAPTLDLGDLGDYSVPAFGHLDNQPGIDLILGQWTGESRGYPNTGTEYQASGDYLSAVFEVGLHDGLTRINYTADAPAGTTVKVDMRAGDVPDTSDASWLAWEESLTDGNGISDLGDAPYVQFRITYTTSDVSVTPRFDDVTVQFRRFAFSQGTAVAQNQLRLAIASQDVAWTINNTWFNTDVGSYAKPALADLDNDGDLDLMMGESAGVVLGYINNGDATAPLWEAEPTWNGVDLGSRAAPAFADLDGDLDYDMMIGNSSGLLYAYENTGDVTTPVWTARPEWDVADVGSETTPALADLDGDGDIDLMLGEGAGVVFGYENTGTASAPVWTANSAWNTPDIGNFASPALADMDADGDVDLMIGDINGFAQAYENTGGVSGPVWTANSAWNSPDIGNYAGPALADVNSDWAVDVIIGDVNGLLFPQQNTGAIVFENSAVFGVVPEYSSAVIDVGAHQGFISLNYTASAPVGTTLTVDARSGPTDFPDHLWSAWVTDIANGGDLSALGNERYVQYRVNMDTLNLGITPSLADIEINFNHYAYNQTLVSSPYDTTDNDNLVDALTWTETLPVGTDVRIQLRTAPDNSGTSWSPWSGPDGTATSYWNSANTFAGGCTVGATVSCNNIPPVFRDGLDDRWLQYQITLVSAGDTNPVVADVGVSYATPTTGGAGDVIVSVISGNTSEAGGIATFSVNLASVPTAAVTVNLASSDTSEGVLSTSSLTFTDTAAQVVTVTGIDDNVDDGDVAYSIILSSVVSSDPDYDDINPSDVVVVNSDDDTTGITVNPTSGLVTEENGASDSFTVVLTSEPTADVTVGLSTDNSNEGTVAPASLVFTSADWNSPQQVTVTGVDDALIDGTVAYNVVTAAAVSADATYSGFNAADVAVSNIDNDAPGAVVSPSINLLTDEDGGFAPFSITLTSQPAQDVTFNIFSNNPQEGTVSPASMTFSPDNWNVVQTGTIFGVTDQVVDGDVTYTVELTPFVSDDPNFNGIDPPDITVTNVDTDGVSVTVTPTSGLVTTEDGGIAEFFVTLGSLPAQGQEVTLHFASSDPTEGRVEPSSITFNSNVNIAHLWEVNVIGLDDREFDNDQTYTIEVTLTTTDPAYAGIEPDDVTVTNLDTNRSASLPLQNDIANSLFGKGVAVADVNCDAIADVLVGTEGQSFDEVAVYYGSLDGYTNTPDWIGRDTVSGTDFGSRVFNVGDVTGDGCDDVLVAARLASSSRGAVYLYPGSVAGLPDGDSDGIGLPSDAVWQVVGDQTFGLLGESAVGGDFDGDGLTDVAVSAYAYDAGQSDEGAVFVFFNSASGLPDADMDGIGLISEAAWRFESDTAAGNAGFNQGLAVANVNGDLYADLFIGVHRATNGQSAEGRVFGFYGSAAGLADVDADGMAHPSDADWSAESDVTNVSFGYAVANAGDLDGNGADDILVGAYQYSNVLTREGAAFLFLGATASGLADADGDGIAHPSDAVWQAFGGDGDAYFGSWLDGAGDFNNDGQADVIIGAYNFNSGLSEGGKVFVFGGTGDGAVLTTTPVWTETGQDASDNYGSRVGLLGDIDSDGYSEVYVSAPNFESSGEHTNEGAVYVYLSQVQPVGIIVTPTIGLITSESTDIPDEFTVVLAAPPLADVTISIASDNPAEGAVSPSQLVFDVTNWAEPQTVVVTGVNDGLFDGDVSYLVSVEPAISADPDYNGFDPEDVSVTNLDNEVPAVVSIVAGDNVGEGSERSAFTISRTGEILADLVVSYVVTGDATMSEDFSALSGALVIPAESSSAELSINVIDDARIEVDETVTITLLPTAEYTVDADVASLMILDNDVAGISVFPSTGLVTTEVGGTDSFAVSLLSEPGDSVTIAWSVSNSAEGAIDNEPAEITFSPSNWHLDQFVTVRGQQDTVQDGDVSFTVNAAPASSTDPNYNGLVAESVSVTNRDDETFPLISVAATTSEVLEGVTGQAVFTITRSGDVSNSLSVFYQLSGTADGLEDFQANLTSSVIPAGSDSVDVLIVPIDDSDFEGNETVNLELAPATDYIVNVPNTATVIIVDDETLVTLPFANFALDQNVGEGGTAEVVIELSRAVLQGEAEITVPYTVSGSAINPDDHDAVDGSVTITLGARATIDLNIVDDGLGDDGETIVFTLEFSDDAQIGDKDVHTITIVETNQSPVVELSADQVDGELNTRVVVAAPGIVRVTATPNDPNPADTHTYDWSFTNPNVLDVSVEDDGLSQTLEFVPDTLDPGFYNIKVIVTDSGAPALSTEANILLEVLAAAPSLDLNADTDGDGVEDGTESYNDTDDDGIPDNLDNFNFADNQLQEFTGAGETYIMQTEAGLSLRLGDVAFAAGANGAFVTTEDIAAYGGGEGQPGVASAEDSVVSATGVAYFDFEIVGLPQAGQSARVVIPTFEPIPSGSAYRKYDPIAGWFDFVEDANNSIASTVGEPGICPPPGDPAFQPGLTAGYNCIQLTIEDGGPNDTDGAANHAIADPGAVVPLGSSGGSGSSSGGGSGGGALSGFGLLVLAVYGAVAAGRRRAVVRRRAR